MSNTLKLLNFRQTQQHPFHALHSSKLPMFMSLFAGSTGLILKDVAILFYQYLFVVVLYRSVYLEDVVDNLC